MTIKKEQLITDKSVYPIKAFGSVIIIIKSLNSLTQIQLCDVAFMPGFFTNIVSLHRFIARGVH
jgi:hypothetical protein